MLNSLAPIMGMYGIISPVVKDGGQTLPYYAGSKFKEAARFFWELMENEYFLSMDGFSGVPDIVQTMAFSQAEYEVGWASIDLPYIYPVCEELLARDPAAQILITPPESGDGGDYNNGMLNVWSAFSPERSWVVGSHVTDEKLIRILQIFNALSFDRKTAVMAAYGEEGVDFTWAGEPYDSAIIETPQQHGGVSLFKGRDGLVTDVLTDVTLQYAYNNSFPYLYEYAASLPARAVTGEPYKEEKALLDNVYQYKLEQIINDNLVKLVTLGLVTDFEVFWNEYIAALNENGLKEYIAFYNNP